MRDCWLEPDEAALFTDLYELTMLEAYFALGMTDTAVFELYYRSLPQSRNYVVAAGLDDVLNHLEMLHFMPDDLEYLAQLNRFSSRCLERLAALRFTGEVWAAPEGALVFPGEPLVQIVAPMPEAHVVETFVLNRMHMQSVLATKCARVVRAAAGHDVVDFGSRRAQGSDAAIKAARATYLAGGAGTSNVFAGRAFNIPVFGTMAHSFIQAHDDELDAFRRFAGVFPDTILLVDTYNTLVGVQNVIRLARELGDQFNVRGIRLDSGDLVALAHESRRMLDQAGLSRITIFASSGLDEYAIRRLVQSGAPIDAFGVGTNMVVSRDEPALDFAYKLVEYAGKARFKTSSGKRLMPGRKQVYRQFTGELMRGDVISQFRDAEHDGQPLLVQVMQNGKRNDCGRETLQRKRERLLADLNRLPARLHAFEHVEPGYPVRISDALREDTEHIPS